MMSTNDVLEQGIAALKAGQKAEARHLLEQVVQQDKDNETAWLWLSGAVDTDRDRIHCLRETLRINPNNQHARRGLEILESKAPVLRPTQPVEGKPTQPPSIREEKKHDIRPIRAVEKPPLDDTKQCPYCAETIKAQAVVCRFCGRNLKTGQPASQPPKAIVQQAPKRKKKSGRIALLALIILIACGVICALGQVGGSIRPALTSTPGIAVRPTPTLTPKPIATVDPKIVKARWSTVDIRALSKNPDRYSGQEVHYRGEVFTIEESDEGTAMQVWVDIPGGSEFDREAVVVYFEGRTDGIYEGTEVEFWGHCIGTLEGTNAFGGIVRQPLISDKYLTYFY